MIRREPEGWLVRGCGSSLFFTAPQWEQPTRGCRKLACQPSKYWIRGAGRTSTVEFLTAPSYLSFRIKQRTHVPLLSSTTHSTPKAQLQNALQICRNDMLEQSYYSQFESVKTSKYIITLNIIGICLVFALVTSSRFGRKEKSKMFSQMQDARQDSYGREREEGVVLFCL